MQAFQKGYSISDCFLHMSEGEVKTAPTSRDRLQRK